MSTDKEHLNMMKQHWVLVVALTSELALCATASAQALQFPGGTSPALQVASSATVSARALATSAPPSRLTDSAGRAFALTYDANGRLAAVKKTSGRNIADMAVGYDANGRIQRVRFDNGYELVFQYRVDGAQEVRDSLGGRLLRTGAPLVAQSITDPSGFLVETLNRIEKLFGMVEAIQGLNAAAASSASP
jgi:YD repeat-containing protein